MQYPGINNNEKNEKLNAYSRMIFDYNKKFNLTGLKTLDEIQTVLISASLLPFSAINVPRGTLIADIGTGAGIPGIPLGILMDPAVFTLIDSTHKKIEFINEVTSKLGLDNILTVCERVEELGRSNLYRESFDWVTTRAMADPYMAAELGAPLLKPGGYLYLYASDKQSDLSNVTINHVSDLGLSEIKDDAKFDVLKTSCGGMLFTKLSSTDARYPRRIKAIKRDSENAG